MKKSINLIALFVAFQLSTFSTFAQDKAQQIEQLLAKYNEYGQFNGSALIAENGKVILKKGFGLANMEWNIPNQPDTKFRLGSITKQFTALLIVKLAEEGKLKLDVPITTYLPDYPKENGDKITTHHLLTHTSGIPNYTNAPNFLKEKARNPYTPEAFVKAEEPAVEEAEVVEEKLVEKKAAAKKAAPKAEKPAAPKAKASSSAKTTVKSTQRKQG